MTRKIKALKEKLKIYNIDGYVVPKNDDYFTEYSKINRLKIISNFSGSAGLAIILKNKNYLFTDGRYTIQSQIESGKNFKIISYEKIINCNLFKNLTLGIDPKLITISKILEKVRGGGIMSDYSIGDGFGEVIEAMIKKQSPLCNKNLKELNLPKSIRIASILRENKIIIPNSNTVFKENDDVVFFAESQYINKLEKLLSTY